jgi:glycogen(starch) synthase
MRLLVITANYPPYQKGGYEIRCKEVIDGLISREHEIFILTSNYSTEKYDIHAEPKYISRSLHRKEQSTNLINQIVNDIADCQLIDRIVKEFDPEIIYLWDIQNLSNTILPYFSDKTIPIYYDEGGSGLIYLRKIYKRGIYFYKNEKDPRVKKIAKETIYNLANRLSRGLIKSKWDWPNNMFIYYNSQSSSDFAADNGVQLGKVRVIYSGINILDFPFQYRKEINSPIKIIIPGRIKALKGTVDGINLIKRLNDFGLQTRLVIVGEIQSKKYYEVLLQASAEHELKEYITFLPLVSIDMLANIYQHSDICFFPSYFKTGLSRVPLEAMASGCLVISYGNEGSKEIITNGRTGYIVEEGDVDSASKVLKHLIEKPEEYRQITQNARAYVEKQHDLNEYINKIEAYLLESISQNKILFINNDEKISEIRTR